MQQVCFLYPRAWNRAPTSHSTLRGSCGFDLFPQKFKCQHFARSDRFQTVLMRVRISVTNVFCQVHFLYYLFWADTLDRTSRGRQWGMLTSWERGERGHCNFVGPTRQSTLSEGWCLHSLRENRHRVPTLTSSELFPTRVLDWLAPALNAAFMSHTLACSLEEQHAVFLIVGWVLCQIICPYMKLECCYSFWDKVKSMSLSLRQPK